jgi:LacI family transcriptional regulator
MESGGTVLSHRNVTLRDVAIAAGVHPATASRALNPDKRLLVNAETVSRVTEAAARLGYVADPLAKALRGGTSQQIGVLVSSLHHPWVGHFLQGVDDGVRAAGYTTWITYSGDDSERVKTLVSAVTSWRAGGLIIGMADVTQDVVALATAAGVPVVLVARNAVDQVCSAVNADNEGGSKSAVAHLVRLGHTSIGAIAGPQSMAIFRARLRADPRVVKIAADPTVAAGQAACRELLASAPGLTAIAAGNDYLAIGCYRGLREAGLRCPQDVSVIGFDDLPLTEHLYPPLSTVHFPGREIGLEAAQLILAQIGGGAPTTRTVLLGTGLVPRESTGVPRVGSAPA